MSMDHPTSTIIEAKYTHGLGKFIFHQPEGSFALTPASMTALEAVFQNQARLCGKGIDWGCGTGCLAIAAAHIERVTGVIGLDISRKNIRAARQNIQENGVEGKVVVELADSYVPRSGLGQKKMEAYRQQTQFVLANPPASQGDDGFEYRRMVLRGARAFLKKGGVVFLSISSQYGKKRIEDLSRKIQGFAYGGLLSSTGWVPFDLQRPELQRCLETYVEEERRGGSEYEFKAPDAGEEDAWMNAHQAMMLFRKTGRSPYSKWQTHLFIFE
jgi:SAM-dependent methyltransferase